MDIGEFMPNLFAYILQSGALLLVGLMLPKIVRLRSPYALLSYYRVLFPTIIFLPFVSCWWPSGGSSILPVEEADYVISVMSNILPEASAPISVYLLIAALAVVSLLRLGWVAIGLATLAKLHRRASPLKSITLVRALQDWLGCRAEFLLSDNESGPATFGWKNPTVLLPRDFLLLPGDQQRAVVCHELLHVRRKDWPIGVIEEIVRAILWFHPVVWFLLGRIAICREQIVDMEVVALTGERKAYLEVLKNTAVRRGPISVVAHRFMIKSQLFHRVTMLLSECGISKVRLVFCNAILAAAILVTGITVAQVFPIGDYRDVGSEEERSLGLGGFLVPKPRIAVQAESGRLIAKTFGALATDMSDVRGLPTGEEIASAESANMQTQIDDIVSRRSARINRKSTNKLSSKTNKTKRKKRAYNRILRKRSRLMASKAGFHADLPAQKTKQPSDTVTDNIEVIPSAYIKRIDTSGADQDQESSNPESKTQKILTASGSKQGSNQRNPSDQLVQEKRVAKVMEKRNHAITNAWLVSKVDPVYPQEVALEGMEGDVVFNALIDKYGEVSSVKILETHDQRFNPTVLKAVKRWKYRPATKGGMPVSSWVRGRIQFVCREEMPGSSIRRRCRKKPSSNKYVAFSPAKLKG